MSICVLRSFAHKAGPRWRSSLHRDSTQLTLQLPNHNRPSVSCVQREVHHLPPTHQVTSGIKSMSHCPDYLCQGGRKILLSRAIKVSWDLNSLVLIAMAYIIRWRWLVRPFEPFRRLVGCVWRPFLRLWVSSEEGVEATFESEQRVCDIHGASKTI